MTSSSGMAGLVRRCGVESERSADSLLLLPSLRPLRSSSAALRFMRYSLQWQELHSLGAGSEGGEA